MCIFLFNLEFTRAIITPFSALKLLFIDLLSLNLLIINKI